MARKSRKHLLDIDNHNLENSTDDTEISVYKTAIYSRLSVDNDENNHSIENQINYCKDYIKDKEELNFVGVYKDNGVTGTTYDRPDFTRLMEDVKLGVVNAIVVRDLSRMGRDYIETGVYLERIFPELGVRVIAINDQYDNFAEDQSNEALMIPLQNIINDFYAKDVSRKVSTAFRTKMESGTFQSGSLPYGYMRNETRDRVIVDEAVAPFVKMIFQWKIEGLTVKKIAANLMELNAPNPEYRKIENGVWSTGDCEPTSWGRSTIYGILTNERYIGNTVSGKTIQAKYKGIYPCAKADKKDWFIFEDTHEPIISKEDFCKVQVIVNVASETRQRKMRESERIRNKFINIFENKIYCGDCGRRMYYKRQKIDKCKVDPPEKMWRANYHCSSRERQLNKTCSTHHIQEKVLQAKVLQAIKTQLEVALDYENILLQLKDSEGEQKIKEKQNNAILGLKLRVNSLQKKRSRLYEDFIDGLLNDEEYQFTKESFDNEFQTLNEMLEEMIGRQTAFQNAMSSDNQWIRLIKSIRRAKKLTARMVDRVIEEVRVYEKQRIEVVIKYDDIYQLMVKGVAGVNLLCYAKSPLATAYLGGKGLQEVENAKDES
ncbi:MAG: recombinase family protein [Bacillota bacterium]